MLLHFAFSPCYLLWVTIIPLGLTTPEEWVVLNFTFYIILSFHLLSTDLVNLNPQNRMLLHYAFYTLLDYVSHNCPIGFNYTIWIVLCFTFYIIYLTLWMMDIFVCWRVDGFMFYILHLAIFLWVVINWLSQLEHSKRDTFTFCLLHHAPFRGSQSYHYVKLYFHEMISTDFYTILNSIGCNGPIGFNLTWRVDGFTFYVLSHDTWYFLVIPGLHLTINTSTPLSLSSNFHTKSRLINIDVMYILIHFFKMMCKM